MEDYKNIASFDPRECLLGRISRIQRLTANIFRKYMSPFKVTNSQVSLLFILSKHDILSQAQVSRMAQLEKSSVNRNIKRLIAEGYVKNSTFPLLQITSKGKKLVNTIIPEWEKAMIEIRAIIASDGEIAIDKIHQKLIQNTKI